MCSRFGMGGSAPVVHGGVLLTGPTPQHTIWVNRVPGAKTVKNRAHRQWPLRGVAYARACRLGEHPIQPVLLATYLGAVRDFYHDLLGLEILSESERHLVFRCGGGTQLAVTKNTTGTADTHLTVHEHRSGRSRIRDQVTLSDWAGRRPARKYPVIWAARRG